MLLHVVSFLYILCLFNCLSWMSDRRCCRTSPTSMLGFGCVLVVTFLLTRWGVIVGIPYNCTKGLYLDYSNPSLYLSSMSALDIRRHLAGNKIHVKSITVNLAFICRIYIHKTDKTNLPCTLDHVDLIYKSKLNAKCITKSLAYQQCPISYVISPS